MKQKVAVRWGYFDKCVTFNVRLRTYVISTGVISTTYRLGSMPFLSTVGRCIQPSSHGSSLDLKLGTEAGLEFRIWHFIQINNSVTGWVLRSRGMPESKGSRQERLGKMKTIAVSHDSKAREDAVAETGLQ